MSSIHVGAKEGETECLVGGCVHERLWTGIEVSCCACAHPPGDPLGSCKYIHGCYLGALSFQERCL